VEPVLLPAILAGAFIAIQTAVWWVQPRTRGRRLLRKVRNVPIAEIKDGEWVKVTGVAHAIGAVGISLIGRRDCIGFQTQVQLLGRNTGGTIVLRRESCPTFTIVDGTGTVDVDGPFLFAIDWDHGWSMVTAQGLRILRECGVQTRGLIFWRRFAYREALIQPGDVITVFGLATFEADPTEPPTDLRSPALKIHLRGSGNQRVILADAGRRVSR
jgi:hypothetical protein